VARERIGILGLGLIGGSLALALKGKRGAPEVWGCDRRKETVRQALSAGAIARGCTATTGRPSRWMRSSMSRRSVVLPLPDSPATATKPPWRAVANSTSRM